MLFSEPFRYWNDSSQSDIFSSNIGKTDVDFRMSDIADIKIDVDAHLCYMYIHLNLNKHFTYRVERSGNPSSPLTPPLGGCEGQDEQNPLGGSPSNGVNGGGGMEVDSLRISLTKRTSLTVRISITVQPSGSALSS